MKKREKVLATTLTLWYHHRYRNDKQSCKKNKRSFCRFVVLSSRPDTYYGDTVLPLDSRHVPVTSFFSPLPPHIFFTNTLFLLQNIPLGIETLEYSSSNSSSGLKLEQFFENKSVRTSSSSVHFSRILATLLPAPRKRWWKMLLLKLL